MKSNKTPIALYKNGQLFFIHTDYLETPRAITNNSQTVVWKWDNIDPFGKNSPTNLGINFNLRFMGQYSDNETGLFYNYFRYYNPTTGRYIQPDPIGLAGGLDLYGYVTNNPINGVDPLGLSERDIQFIKQLFYKNIVDQVKNGTRLPGNNKFNENNEIAKRCNPNIQAYSYDLNILYKNNGFSLYQPCSSIDMKKEVCEGQSNILMGYLNKFNDPQNPQKFDDFWKFEYQSKPGHFWAVGVSSNPNDPPIFLDPWKEYFSTSSYCPDCNSIEKFIYPFFYTSIPSKPNMGILK